MKGKRKEEGGNAERYRDGWERDLRLGRPGWKVGERDVEDKMHSFLGSKAGMVRK